jgi:hypothetical protein
LPVGFADTELACGRRAIEHVFQDYESYTEMRKALESIRHDFYSAFWSSDPVREVDSAWSECMSNSGYEYRSTEDARAAGVASTTAEEARIARADALCRAKTAYDDRLEVLFDAADANFALENSSLILALEEASTVSSHT